MGSRYFHLFFSILVLGDSSLVFSSTLELLPKRSLPVTAALINICRRFDKIEGIQDLLSDGKAYSNFHKEVDLKEMTKPLLDIDVRYLYYD